MEVDMLFLTWKFSLSNVASSILYGFIDVLKNIPNRCDEMFIEK